MQYRRRFAVLLLALTMMLPAGTAVPAEPGPAPDFELPVLTGTSFRLSSFRGRVVVMNFWATWCPECLVELDSLSRFHDRYRDKGVAVLGISIDRSEALLRKFLQDHPVSFPVAVDSDGEVFVRKYLLRGLPATIIVDPKGAMTALLMGKQDFLDRGFTRRIDGLLDAAKQETSAMNRERKEPR